MTKDKAIDIIFSSPQYLELMKALEEAKKTISPDEFGRYSHRKRRVIFLGGALSIVVLSSAK
jgi:hypothetical protein